MLASTSYLTHLTLYADSLTALPPDFLTAPPQLRHLALYTDRLVALPPDFLTVTPRLTVLVLWSSCLSALPPNFLRTSLPYIHLHWEGSTNWPLPSEHIWPYLWDLNRRRGIYAGPFIVTTAPLVNLRDYPSLTQGQVVGQVTQSSFIRIFPVINRYTDETGQMWLHLWVPLTDGIQPPRGDLNWLPPYHRLFQTTEEIWIAADYVELIEANRDGRNCHY